MIGTKVGDFIGGQLASGIGLQGQAAQAITQAGDAIGNLIGGKVVL